MAPSVPAIVTCAASPLTTTDAPLLATVMVSSPAVPLTITVSAAPSPWPLPAVPDRSMLTCVTSVPVRSLTVMVSAPPRALNWMCSTPLRSMVMLATSRRQPHAAAIGRDVDVLGDVGAVEHQRIGAGLALDDVAAVARIPDERVVAVAEQGHVVAAAADHGVVAVAADAACRRPGCR